MRTRSTSSPRIIFHTIPLQLHMRKKREVWVWLRVVGEGGIKLEWSGRGVDLSAICCGYPVLHSHYQRSLAHLSSDNYCFCFVHTTIVSPHLFIITTFSIMHYYVFNVPEMRIVRRTGCNGENYLELPGRFNIIYKCTSLPREFVTAVMILRWCSNTKWLKWWVMLKIFMLCTSTEAKGQWVKATVSQPTSESPPVQSAVRRKRPLVVDVYWWISRWQSFKVPVNSLINLSLCNIK